MNPALARRQAALAGVALVGALGAIALTRIGEGEGVPPPAAVVEWEEARVAVLEATGEPTECGATLTAEIVGIAHPVLPCGATIVVDHGGRLARVEVVARGPVDAGRAFDLSPALAEALGVSGETVVRWRFAG